MGKQYAIMTTPKFRDYIRLACLALLSGILLGLAISMLISEVNQSFKVVLFFLLTIHLSNLLAKLVILYQETFA